MTGKIEAGYVQVGERLLVMPPNETCTVKGTVYEPKGFFFSLGLNNKQFQKLVTKMIKRKILQITLDLWPQMGPKFL